MKNNLCRFALAMVICVSLLAVSAADDGTWKMPNLNPFASKAKPPTSGRVAGPTAGSWHFPNLLPGAAAKRRTNQPSTWQKMTSGTKSWMSKTTSALNPWDDKQAAAKPAPAVSGSNSMFSQATKKKAAAGEEKSGSIVPASWWTGEKDKQEQPPKSVNEFLSRPRPQ